MYNDFEKMNQEERQEYINNLHDKLIEFIKQMAINTNTLDKFNLFKSGLSYKELKVFAEDIADQLGRRKELDDLVEEIEIFNILKERM